MKVLITGANGQLGRALNKLMNNVSAYEVVNTDVWNIENGYPETFAEGIEYLDLTKSAAVEEKIQSLQPDVIINCAAYTAVDKAEEDEETAKKINSDAPGYLAKAAKKTGAALVHISTDYVFDGEKTSPYDEGDTPNPQSAYGRTKLLGEQQVQKEMTKYFIIRTAWLYGDGNNFVRTMLRLSKTMDELKVVSDQFGAPTYTIELAKMILHLITTEKYGIYHGTCQGKTSWYDFANKIFEAAGISQKVTAVTTKEYGSKTKRPAYSVLANNRLAERPLCAWEEALDAYLASDCMKDWLAENEIFIEEKGRRIP